MSWCLYPGVMTKLLICCTLLLSACASIAEQEQPALIVEASEQSYADLVRAVSDALNAESITIAKDALTKDSTLFIERVPARDVSGQRLSGRDLDRPEQFRLFKRGAQCVLVHARTGERAVLEHTSCEALPQ